MENQKAEAAITKKRKSQLSLCSTMELILRLNNSAKSQILEQNEDTEKGG
jgi:hypothetical protein